MAGPGPIGLPDTGPPPGLATQLRRWGALFALAGVVMPGAAPDRPPRTGPVAVEAAVEVPAAPTPLPLGDPWEAMVVEPAPPAPAAPWEAALLEPDGTPLPVAPAGGPGVSPEMPGGPGVSPEMPGGPGVSPAAPAVAVPPERAHLRPVLVRYAQENGLPADLVMAMAWVESSWRTKVVSASGAIGVMQLMPATVEFASRQLLRLDHRLDPRDPAANIRMGTRFLRHLIDLSGGNLRRGLMAYNQGLTSLRRDGPYRQSERYTDRIFALRPAFR